MAWIESHQALRGHPKTRKAARALSLPVPHLIGHLHCLWHWALDVADDGDLSKFSAEDIAIGAEWDGDPEAFVTALTECGFGDGPGFLEMNGSCGDPAEGRTGSLVLHDWWDYAGKLVARRMRDRRRKSDPAPLEPPTTSIGVPTEVRRNAGKDQNQPTNQPTSRRKTRLPEGWSPNAAHAAKASDAGIDCEHEAEQFRNHHGAKGSTFVDWDKAFHTWLGNASKWAKDRRPVGVGRSDGNDWLDRA